MIDGSRFLFDKVSIPPPANFLNPVPPSESSPIATLPLDEFIALNDEVVALMRAGVPLEQGLVDLGDDLPGRLGHVARDMGQRIQAGESLGHILLSSDSAYPPLWRAVVGAGLRTGKLVTALEGISATARRVADLKREIRTAMIYPWVVTAIAFVAFVLLVTQLAPRIAFAYRELTSRHSAFLDVLVWLGGSVQWWGTLIPIAAALYLLTASWRSRRVVFVSEDRRLFSSWNWWPGLRRAIRDGRMANFAETLALLIDHQVPFDEALLLAGDASGDRQIGSVVRVISERLNRGEIISPKEAQKIGFPPLLAWLLSTEERRANLSLTLTQIADRCRQRSFQETSHTLAIVPIAATALIGGLVTLAIGIAMFLPISQMLYDLGGPSR